jgi:cell division protease FtsH
MMTMLLAGRGAEQLIFGSVTNGAADDLKRVADIAHAMIHEYAMGTEITSQKLSDYPQSEASRRLHDAEVRELADEAFRAATDMLAHHRPALDLLAGELLAKETLERREIDLIMDGIPLARPDRRPGNHLGLAAATPIEPSSESRPAKQ